MNLTTQIPTQYVALYQEINELKAQRNAVILAHYYQRPEIQQIADYLGDSLGLSQQAATTNADVIVFCGVHFMAETAAIISPNKKVLIPTHHAGCSLAESVTAAGLATWKKYHPGGLVVSYVNTTAEVKAETDYCVTSANALKVIQALPTDVPILFGPDKNLGAYIMRVTGREMDLWQGDCYVHRYISSELVQKYLQDYPQADVLIHPESAACSDKSILSNPRCFIGSTTGIMKYPEQSPLDTFVIATEPDTLAELSRKYPQKRFIPITTEHRCEYMKLTTLEDLRDALRYEQHQVTVPEEIRRRAILPIERMLQFS